MFSLWIVTVGIAAWGASTLAEAASSVDEVCDALACSVECEGDLAACQGDLAACEAELESCQAFPATGQADVHAPGDDGELRAGAPMAFVDNGDGTIDDVNTGLTWEKKVLGDGIQNFSDLHDADNLYAWSGAGSIFDWVASLNAQGLGGHHDWRIPNAKELQSIVDYGRSAPSVAPAFHGAACGATCTDPADPDCSCTRSSDYWSSTTDDANTSYAWHVFFKHGHVLGRPKTTRHHVRAVRGGF